MLAPTRWVAIVDDDEMIRRALARMLRARGIESRTFDSARAFLGETLDSPPACMIVDMHLRDTMTGLELCEHLHALHIAPPAILITAQEQTVLEANGRAPRNIVLLCKPFDPEVMLELVVQRVGAVPSGVAR